MALQKAPRGLADLLGLYQQGRVPLEYSGFVGLELDALKWLADPQTVVTSGNVTTIGGGPTILIPDSEIWLIHAISCYTTGAVAVGDSIGVNPYIVFNKSTGAHFNIDTGLFNIGASAGQVLAVGQIFGTPFKSEPGGSIVSNIVRKDTGANATIFLAVQYSKFSI